MFWLAFVLMIIAGVFFLLDAFRPRAAPVRLFISLGLAFLTAGLIVQFITKTTSGLIVVH